MTTVVNIRHADAAPFVYVGRAGKGESGLFGNPYRVQQYGARALPMFAQYLRERVATDPEFRAALEKLRGQRLGCFCRPKRGFGGKVRCHAQLIAAWLDNVKPDVP